MKEVLTFKNSIELPKSFSEYLLVFLLASIILKVSSCHKEDSLCKKRFLTILNL